MNLGDRLLTLRKSKQLSQEEVAEKLNVSRQTISKWETDQSTPDFDKIVPLCELYGITPDELLMGKKEGVEEVQNKVYNVKEDPIKKSKKAKGISIGVLLYFAAIAWIMISVPVLRIDPIVSSAVFLLICGIASYLIIYVCIMYRTSKVEKEKKENSLRQQISGIIAIITTIIYLFISFVTMAWHITWIIWIIYGLIDKILKLIFTLRGLEDEK